MANEVYVITGATGNIGYKVVEKLLAAKLKVRAIGRKAEKLKPLASKGAEAFVATLDDTGSITRAFTGAKAVFTMIPPNYGSKGYRAEQNRISQSFAASITGAGVRYAVNLSSVGAHLSSKLGPINGLYDNEQRLNRLEGANVLHLRPTFFMENLLGNIDLIRKMGINGGALKPELAIPMIATVDIANEVTERLLKLDFTGKPVKELLGPRDYTMNEVTRIIGTVLGLPDLKYSQFPYEDAKKAMLGMGMSEDMAAQFIEMTTSMNDGIFKPTESRNAKNTTKTKFEEFAQIFSKLPPSKPPVKQKVKVR